MNKNNYALLIVLHFAYSLRKLCIREKKFEILTSKFSE